MTIKFSLNREDYWNFNKYCMIHTSQYRNFYIFGILFLVILFSYRGIKLSESGDFSLPFYLVFCFIVTSIGLIITYFITRILTKYLPSKNGAMLCEHQIEINENGVNELTDYNESHCDWRGIYNITQNKQYIFLFVDKMQGHIIPKNAFNTESEATIFFCKAMEYWHSQKCQVKQSIYK